MSVAAEQHALSAGLQRTAASTKQMTSRRSVFWAAGGAVIGAIVGGKKGAVSARRSAAEPVRRSALDVRSRGPLAVGHGAVDRAREGHRGASADRAGVGTVSSRFCGSGDRPLNAGTGDEAAQSGVSRTQAAPDEQRNVDGKQRGRRSGLPIRTRVAMAPSRWPVRNMAPRTEVRGMRYKTRAANSIKRIGRTLDAG